MDHACKQQIVSFSLCVVKRFIAFPLTKWTDQRHCKGQDDNRQSLC